MREHFGAEVRASAATWLVLKPMDRSQARRNAADIGVAPEDLLQLRGGGEGFFRSHRGGRPQKVQVQR